MPTLSELLARDDFTEPRAWLLAIVAKSDRLEIVELDHVTGYETSGYECFEAVRVGDTTIPYAGILVDRIDRENAIARPVDLISIGALREQLQQLLGVSSAVRAEYLVKDVASDLSVSTDTVYGWISSGQLESTNVGAGRNSYRISQGQLDRFKASRTTTGPVRAKRGKKKQGFPRANDGDGFV